MTGSAIISEVHALMYVVLRLAKKKYVLKGKLLTYLLHGAESFLRS
jgi:hypothetical protein